MIMRTNDYEAAQKLARALQGLEPAERLVVLSLRVLVRSYGWRGAVGLDSITLMSGLEETEACKACLLLLLRGFLRPGGAGPWDFVLDPERVP